MISAQSVWAREAGKGQNQWKEVTSLVKNQSFKRCVLYPMPYAPCSSLIALRLKP